MGDQPRRPAGGRRRRRVGAPVGGDPHQDPAGDRRDRELTTATTLQRPRRHSGRWGDRLFSGAALGAGAIILAVLAGVAAFLLREGWPALTADASAIPGGDGLAAYIGPLVFGTVLSAGLAILIAVPLAVAVSLFITFYAPRRLAGALGSVVDLLAAVPSIVFGLWGIAVLGPASVDLQRWLVDHLGWIPLFDGPASATGRTMLVVGFVLALMILPIISAVTREVFARTPRSQIEGALALGATRWEVIRMTVLPFGRSAIVGGSMLGLGRALGETMAVAIILSVSGVVTVDLVSSGNPSTIAANIALDFPESSGLDVNVLIASGLVLFGITLVVNTAARALIARGEAGARS
ncbi:MAG TPA: phosphate ABC transporter permease subunit PstC [Miltoncostaeaceae bacterium]|nr:phosphate ABC transporter permease subunit PstC [Miltoncostaeaceae bacterium]